MSLKKLKTYDCWLNDSNHPTSFIGTSASQARYQFYIHLDGAESYREIFRYIKSRCVGTVQPYHFYGDIEQFNRMCIQRNITFVRQGMVVDVNGKKGWIVGGNEHLNLEVLFEGERYTSNCHPTWETTYYDHKMNIIKNFKNEGKT